MNKPTKISTSFESQNQYKRTFSFGELYRSFIYIPSAIIKLKSNRKKNLVSPSFIERLQLAVTEVNGCPACSYQHTKMALRIGMSNKEISSFLSGGEEFIKPNEAKAILFAQHFADSRAFPKKYTFDALINEYGKERAEVILSATQVMISGNMYGIPYSAFQARLKGTKYINSNLLYEFGMLVGGILILPLALMHGFFRIFIGLPNKRLDTT